MLGRASRAQRQARAEALKRSQLWVARARARHKSDKELPDVLGMPPRRFRDEQEQADYEEALRRYEFRRRK